MRFCVAVDLGATRLRVGIVSEDGSVLAKYEEPTLDVLEEAQSGDAIAERIIDVACRLCRGLGLDVGSALGVGVGSIGPLDLRRGQVVNPPNLPVRRIVIRDYIRDKIKVPVIVANDCVAAVWGEKILGACRSSENIVYITFSTGIGGGVIVNDTLLLGADGNAHEIGHAVIDPSDDAIPCGCGGKGHWEAYCSGTGIPKLLTRIMEKNPEYKSHIEDILSRGDDPRIVTVEYFTCLNRGCKICSEIFRMISRYNAAGVATCIHYYNPEVVILGGSIALRNRDKILMFREYLPQFLASSFRVPEFRFATFEDDEVLVGAAALVFKPPSTLLRFMDST